jgi:uncharacterized protein with HEPN domain
MKDVRSYLEDLLENLRRVQRFTAEGRAAFMDDEKTQYAVIRAYEVIGEIAKRLPQPLRDTNAQVDWRKLIGFRDFLAHNYEEIILEFVWTAVEDLPNLKTAVEAIMHKLDVNQSSDGDVEQ